ncbi:A/G-specific adenine glycosylase [Virgibacillus kimchii]
MNIFAFQHDLLTWYHENKRDLPWREDQNPYKIWVSEIMLQQTKVDTVIPYFNRFIEKFPTPEALAEANEQDVLKAWEGLGYYSRARNLQNAVREVVSSYGGKVPENEKELGELKGIGPYTKGAILSIAYNQPVPAIDGNVMRVFSRLLLIEEDISLQRTKKLVEEKVREMISTEDPASFNQAIMELGALVCTPRSPGCLLCPVQSHCEAFAHGREEELPVKAKAKKQREVSYVVLLIRNENDEYLIEKRPEKGLLANLWQFPMVPLDKTNLKQVEEWTYENYGIRIRLENKLGKLNHVFTHLIWNLEVYEAATDEIMQEKDSLRFADRENLETYPFPVSHQKMMKYLRD